MLVEDCKDEFYVDNQGGLWVESKNPETGMWSTLKWRGDEPGAHPDVGNGWQEDFFV